MTLVLAIADLPVEARDGADLAELAWEFDRGVTVGEGLLDGDDCAAAAAVVAPVAAAEFTGADFLGVDFVVVTVVEGVLPGTGFSLRLFTFCC